MGRRKKSTGPRTPDKRTIQSDLPDRYLIGKYKWNDGILQCRFYEIAQSYRIKSLRGAVVQPRKKVGKTTYTATLLCKRKGGWRPGDVIRIKVHEIISHYKGDD